MITIEGDTSSLGLNGPEVSLGNLIEAINNGQVRLLDGRGRLQQAVNEGLTRVKIQVVFKSGIYVRVGPANVAIEDMTDDQFEEFKKDKSTEDAWRYFKKVLVLLKEKL